jgi:hypothetical protein
MIPRANYFLQVSFSFSALNPISSKLSNLCFRVASQQIYVQEFTDLAKKYSHPRGIFNGINHLPLRGTKKSGLTPLSPKFSDVWKREKRRRNLETYQRSRFHGYTADELHRFEALAALDETVMRHGLTNPIHAVFEKKQWLTEGEMPRHRGAIPILGGEDGFWLVSSFLHGH